MKELITLNRNKAVRDIILKMKHAYYISERKTLLILYNASIVKMSNRPERQPRSDHSGLKIFKRKTRSAVYHFDTKQDSKVKIALEFERKCKLYGRHT